MIYIIVALKAEAQAFVDKFKLKNYKNDKICVIISGIGKENMHKTTSQVLKEFSNDDKIVNVGICGASEEFEIGELLSICVPTQSVGTRGGTNLSLAPMLCLGTLTCVDKEIGDKDRYDVVDMESAGFLQATKDIKNRYIFKVVSDHFEPKRVTKDSAKRLIFNKIDEIMMEIKR
ncbi:MAG: hypothetical protein J7L21_02565 [Sulfurimonas sp.]|nr:hypothetical protein [Sulfurimonas sp.]